MITPKLVAVEWTDASFELDNSDYGVYHTWTTGWLMKSGERYIAVASERLMNNKGVVSYRQFTSVPNEMVIRMINLKPTKGTI